MRKLKVIIPILIVLLLGSGIAYYYFNNSQQTQRTERNENPAQNVNDDNDTSQPEDKTPIQYSPSEDNEAPTDNNTISGVITRKSSQNGTLVIRTTISELLSSGNCTLSITRSTDGKKVTRLAEIVQNPSSSSCKGFDIPTSELGKGEWTIFISISSEDKKGEIRDKVSL